MNPSTHRRRSATLSTLRIVAAVFASIATGCAALSGLDDLIKDNTCQATCDEADGSDDVQVDATGTHEGGADDGDAGHAPSPSSDAADETSSDDAATPDTSIPESGIADTTPPIDAAVNCNAWDAEVEVEASILGSTPSVDNHGNPLPGPPALACSSGNGGSFRINTENNAPCTIEFWWVDYNCEEEQIITVKPNQQGQYIDAYEGQPFRIRAAGSHKLLREIPASNNRNTQNVVYP